MQQQFKGHISQEDILHKTDPVYNTEEEIRDFRSKKGSSKESLPKASQQSKENLGVDQINNELKSLRGVPQLNTNSGIHLRT